MEESSDIKKVLDSFSGSVSRGFMGARDFVNRQVKVPIVVDDQKKSEPQPNLPSFLKTGGRTMTKRYMILTYHGGEQSDEIHYADTLAEARTIASQAEHAEIIDQNTNEAVFGKGGAVKPTLKGIVYQGEYYSKKEGQWVDCIDLYGYDSHWKDFMPTKEEKAISRELLKYDLEILDSVGVKYVVEHEKIHPPVIKILKINDSPISDTKKLREVVNFKLDKFKEGGMVDLFEDYKNIPPNIQEILDKYSEDFKDGNYEGLAKALKEVEANGYTFEYYLDGSAYGLRPLGVPLSDLEGFEEEEFAKGGEITLDQKEDRFIRILLLFLAGELNIPIKRYFNFPFVYRGDLERAYESMYGEKAYLNEANFKALVSKANAKATRNVFTLDMNSNGAYLIKVKKFENGGEIESLKLSNESMYPNRLLEKEDIVKKINWLEQQIESDYNSGEIDDKTNEYEEELVVLKNRLELIGYDKYQYAKGGTISAGDWVTLKSSGKRHKVARLITKGGKTMYDLYVSQKGGNTETLLVDEDQIEFTKFFRAKFVKVPTNVQVSFKIGDRVKFTTKKGEEKGVIKLYKYIPTTNKIMYVVATDSGWKANVYQDNVALESSASTTTTPKPSKKATKTSASGFAKGDKVVVKDASNLSGVVTHVINENEVAVDIKDSLGITMKIGAITNMTFNTSELEKV